MPRVRPLTVEQRQREADQRSNEVLAHALRRHKADTGRHDKDFSDDLGVSTSAIKIWKKRPEIMSLAMARRIAHECKLTPEEWLAVGGYKT